MNTRHAVSSTIFFLLIIIFLLFVSIKTKGVSDSCKDGVDESKSDTDFSCGCGSCDYEEDEKSYSSCNETDSSGTTAEPSEV